MAVQVINQPVNFQVGRVNLPLYRPALGDLTGSFRDVLCVRE